MNLKHSFKLDDGKSENNQSEKYSPVHVTSDRNYLNPNHTHFILVDNGTEGKRMIEYDLRMRLEAALDKKWENQSSMMSND